VGERRRLDPLPLGGEHGLPYSKGLMARALMAVGVRPDRAYEVASRIELDVVDTGRRSAELAAVQERVIELLGEEDGAQTLRRLLRYRDLQRLDAPILLLLGGATGTGKSTVATELAYRLGITRVTSTDFVRQTMRAFFAEEYMPSIHKSSFEVGLDGFVEQTRNVLVGVRAAIDRALTEGWSMVLEGVHLVPGSVTAELPGALAVQCVLAIEEAPVHESHFLVRDAVSKGLRNGDKYLRSFAEIREIQEYIVEKARRRGVPVIENRSIEETIGAVMELVLAAAERPQEAHV
jgi:2-phosphoglycerate kinase